MRKITFTVVVPDTTELPRKGPQPRYENNPIRVKGREREQSRPLPPDPPVPDCLKECLAGLVNQPRLPDTNPQVPAWVMLLREEEARKRQPVPLVPISQTEDFPARLTDPMPREVLFADVPDTTKEPIWIPAAGDDDPKRTLSGPMFQLLYCEHEKEAS